MRYIAKIAVQNDTGTAYIPAEPLPTDALLIVSDGEKYTIYEEGDELPLPPPTDEDAQHNAAIMAQIEAVEATINPRWIRTAPLGDTFAIMKLRDIENEVANLRTQLRR